jgi:hypothetical protein
MIARTIIQPIHQDEPYEHEAILMRQLIDKTLLLSPGLKGTAAFMSQLGEQLKNVFPPQSDASVPEIT